MSVTSLQSQNQRLDGLTNQPIDTLFGRRDLGFTWRRNPAWPEYTKPALNEQKVVGLYAVFGDGSNIGNFFAITCAGAYTVDFGDGSTPVNTASSTATNYQYSFNASGLYDAVVTFTDSGDLVSRTDHGYTDGDDVQFYRIQSTTGITEGQTYYVINATKDIFQISATIGGSPIALTTDGSASLLPYKIATVTITPQAGQNFTLVNFQTRHSQLRLSDYNAGWLDVSVCMPVAANQLVVSSGSPTVNLHLLENFELIRLVSPSVYSTAFTLRGMRGLRRAIIGPINVSTSFNIDNIFNTCSALTDVYFDPSVKVASALDAFNGCVSLTNAPMIYFRTIDQTTLTSDAVGLFRSCTNLKNVPLFDTSRVGNMSNMFQNCTALETVPAFDTTLATTFDSMFQSCSNLKTVPLFNTQNVTSMLNMFSGCQNLRSVPLFNTQNVISMTGMFVNCRNLKTVPLFNTQNVTSMDQTFSGCNSLRSVPLFNTIKVTSFSSMFANCNSLVTVPAFNFAAASINASSMFQGCTSLLEVPAINANNVSSGSNFSNIFSSCPSLQRIRMTNIRFTFSVSGCSLSGAALNEIYTNLPNLITAQTITVSNNWGNDADDPTIATNKNWGVTGS